MFKDSHYAAQATASLHDTQARIVLGGVAGDDFDEAFKYGEGVRNYFGLAYSSSKDCYRNFSSRPVDTPGLGGTYW